MSTLMRFFYYLLFIVFMLFPCAIFAERSINIPILCYHNFSPTVPGSMNMTPQTLESQLQWLKQNGYTVIPLKMAVEYLLGTRASLPAKAVVVTVDDGWQSVYTYMLPLVKKYNIPVTLFIYPSTISSGKHALTWNELKELQATGLFDIQGHTYTHPNFKREKRGRTEISYQQFVTNELVKSKKILETQLGTQITLLAWPFGIYNDYLKEQAAKAGYIMAFSIDATKANRSFTPMAEPRYMILQGQSMKTFVNIVNTSS